MSPGDGLVGGPPEVDHNPGVLPEIYQDGLERRIQEVLHLVLLQGGVPELAGGEIPVLQLENIGPSRIGRYDVEPLILAGLRYVLKSFVLQDLNQILLALVDPVEGPRLFVFFLCIE